MMKESIDGLPVRLREVRASIAAVASEEKAARVIAPIRTRAEFSGEPLGDRKSFSTLRARSACSRAREEWGRSRQLKKTLDLNLFCAFTIPGRLSGIATLAKVIITN
jgi:hypothetical protein